MEQRLDEMLLKQLAEVEPLVYKMGAGDMMRLLHKLTDTPVHPVVCVYLQELKYSNSNPSRMRHGLCYNFYLHNQKFLLHRVLYANFVGKLSRNQYIRCSCGNTTGVCFNVNHYTCHDYSKPIKEKPKREPDKPPPKLSKKFVDPDIQITRKPILMFDVIF